MNDWVPLVAILVFLAVVGFGGMYFMTRDDEARFDLAAKAIQAAVDIRLAQVSALEARVARLERALKCAEGDGK